MLPTLLVASLSALPPIHNITCDGRPCRPGEGNPSVTHDNNPYEMTMPPDALKYPPHEPDPKAQHYAPLAARAASIARHHLVFLSVADYDFRELAENWHRALQRLGHTNALVFSLEPEAFAHLTARSVTTVDGSANLEAWKRTRLSRHLQRVSAEKYMAGAAVAASGLDVLLMDTTHVALRDPTPLLHQLVRDGSFDVAVGRGMCNGRPPLGCGIDWSLQLLRGSGTEQQRSSIVTWQAAAIKHGMVDFYLRWWNGNHCIMSGFGKKLGNCNPRLAQGLTPAETGTGALNSTILFDANCGGGNPLHMGLLPPALFNSPMLYGRNAPDANGAAIGRSAKPVQRDRLRLDRYDEQDFTEIVTAMKADALWFL